MAFRQGWHGWGTTKGPDNGPRGLNKQVSGGATALRPQPTDCETSNLIADYETVKQAANPGDKVTYTISVINEGQVPFTAASPATFVDDLSGDLADAVYNSDATASEGTLSHAAPTLSWSGALPVGATVTVTDDLTTWATPPTTVMSRHRRVRSAAALPSLPGRALAPGATATVTCSGDRRQPRHRASEAAQHSYLGGPVRPANHASAPPTTIRRVSVAEAPAGWSLIATGHGAVPRYPNPGTRSDGTIPATCHGGQSALPVINERPGWLQVRLAHPTQRTGGLGQRADVTLSSTPYRIW